MSLVPPRCRDFALRLRSLVTALAVPLALVAAPAALAQQPPGPRGAGRVSVSFEEASLPEVLSFFARYAGRSIVAGTGVAGSVTARIEDQPWDEALGAIASAHGFIVRELPSGILVVQDPAATVEAPGPLVTRVFRLSYTPAAELEPVVRTMLSDRGSVGALPSANALVVTDEARVIEQVAAALGQP